jgi:hypothetical protein
MRYVHPCDSYRSSQEYWHRFNWHFYDQRNHLVKRSSIRTSYRNIRLVSTANLQVHFSVEWGAHPVTNNCNSTKLSHHNVNIYKPLSMKFRDWDFKNYLCQDINSVSEHYGHNVYSFPCLLLSQPRCIRKTMTSSQNYTTIETSTQFDCDTLWESVFCSVSGLLPLTQTANQRPSCCTSRFSSQYGLMVFNFGVVPVKATEISYKDSRIE